MRVDGLKSMIVGVLPPGFRYLSSRAQLFFPLASGAEDRGIDRRHSNNLQIVARLRPGATLGEAQAQIDALNAKQVAEDPYSGLVKGAVIAPAFFRCTPITCSKSGRRFCSCKVAWPLCS